MGHTDLMHALIFRLEGRAIWRVLEMSLQDIQLHGNNNH